MYYISKAVIKRVICVCRFEDYFGSPMITSPLRHRQRFLSESEESSMSASRAEVGCCLPCLQLFVFPGSTAILTFLWIKANLSQELWHQRQGLK